MEYSIEKIQDGVILIRPRGNMWGGLKAYPLKDEIRVQLEMGARKFLLDLEKVDGLNSAGIGIIVSAMVTIQAENGRLALCGLGTRVRRALEGIGVYDVLEVHEGRESALRALTAPGSNED